MDDWSEDELISEDDIPAEIENQDTDLGMNSFLSELVQKILEGVKQDKLHTEDDILSELQNQNNDLSFVIEPVQKTIEEVEQDKLHTEDDNLSELQNQDNDLSINSFVNEFVQNVIELAIRNTSVEHKATAKIDTSFATQQKMDNSPKKSEMSGSEDESDFEDFLQEMLSSINMMIQSMNKGESAKLPSASETSITTDTHTSLIPSHTDKHAHTANSSSPHWNITRARSAPCLQQLSEHNRVTLHKALSDTTILQAKHVTPIMDFSDIQFLKVNSSIAEDKIVRTVNQYPGIQADKPVGADLARIPINAMSTISILPPVEAAHVDIPLVTVTPGAISIPPLHTTPTIVTDNVSATIDKTSNGITSAIVDIPSTSATPVTMSNIQVPCNDTKKSSIVKRARIRVSYAFRRMTRLLTACSSGRESTKKSHWRPSKQHSAINMEDDSQPTV